MLFNFLMNIKNNMLCSRKYVGCGYGDEIMFVTRQRPWRYFAKNMHYVSFA